MMGLPTATPLCAAALAAVVAIGGTSSTAIAKPKTAASASTQAQDDAAANKLARTPSFVAVLNAGQPDEAKKMLVASGASPKLVVGIEKLKFNWSSGGASNDEAHEYVCSSWMHYWTWYWHTTPPWPPLTAPIQEGNLADGEWNMGWRCVGVVTHLPPNPH